MASSSKETENFWNMIPPGYRFDPRDEELITHYLVKKINGEALPPNKMHEVELYGVFGPQDLTLFYESESENIWYFFTRLERLYENGSRPKRSAGNGYWKATGADATIRNEQGNIIGFKKALSFFVRNQPKGIKTSWLMQEFRLNNVPSTPEPKPKKRKRNDHDGVHSTTTSQPEGSKPKNMLDGWVLCKVYKLARDVAVEAPNPGAEEEHNQVEHNHQGVDISNNEYHQAIVALNEANYTSIPTTSNQNIIEDDSIGHLKLDQDPNMSPLKPCDFLDYDALHYPQPADNALLNSTNMDMSLQPELLHVEEHDTWQPHEFLSWTSVENPIQMPLPQYSIEDDLQLLLNNIPEYELDMPFEEAADDIQVSSLSSTDEVLKIINM